MIHRLTIYAFLVGVGTAAAIYYLPFYAKEALEMTSEQAGQALAFSGLVGIVGRIGWARVAESRLGTVRSSMIIAVLAVVASVALAFGTLLGTWSIRMAAGLIGISVSAWHSVRMLAVIQIVPSRVAGRGSGLVYFGFLTGLGGVPRCLAGLWICSVFIRPVGSQSPSFSPSGFGSCMT